MCPGAMGIVSAHIVLAREGDTVFWVEFHDAVSLTSAQKKNTWRKSVSGPFYKGDACSLRWQSSVLLPYFQKAFYWDFKTEVN